MGFDLGGLDLGDIVRVPFPHIERNRMTVRPAMVLTPSPIGPNGLLIWAAMITNAKRDVWPDDIVIDDWEALGLIVPSRVRTTKITPVEAKSASLLGKADDALIAQVRATVAKHLQFNL